ncbi:MAG: hypothetical protein ABC378_02945 [Staphylococcus pseudoxylosus]|uniref:hypothetical protein n=1 Tax=Staphylococcus pseudoxylosus TaxID=2282419 RepID=UPI0031F69E8F
MTNGIDKKALFKLKSEPYSKPISDLGVVFYNLDENTAVLRFQLSNTKGPLLIHKNNLTAYAYFESSNGSVSDVIELEVKDSNKGLVTITLDKEFLQASTSTKVRGQVYIGVNNVDNKPEYNEVAVFREFNFEVKDTLINKISSFTKVEYIRMFSQLKMKIEQQVKDIEEAIANGADYVAEMKSVLQKGIETLNQIVSDGKQDIQSYIKEAKATIDTTQADAVDTVEKLSKDTQDSVEAKANKVVETIRSTSKEATDHVDDKVSKFNKTVEDNGFLSPDMLDEEIEKLDWQRYKLTNNDGGYITISLNEEIEKLHALEPGFYYFTSTPITGASSKAGYAQVETRSGISNIKRITFKPYNSEQIWVKRLYNDWEDWVLVSQTQNDTGWIPFNLINGATTNTAFKGTDDNGFDCAYRIETRGRVTEKTIRLNSKNLKQSQVIAQLPSNLFKNAHSFSIRVPTSIGFSGGYITARPNGEVKFYINGDSSTWNETAYIYGEYSWKE